MDEFALGGDWATAPRSAASGSEGAGRRAPANKETAVGCERCCRGSMARDGERREARGEVEARRGEARRGEAWWRGEAWRSVAWAGVGSSSRPAAAGWRNSAQGSGRLGECARRPAGVHAEPAG